RLDALDEVIDLGRVLLTAHVEPDGTGEVGGVAEVPAWLEVLERLRKRAQVDLDLLPVDIDAAVRAPEAELHGHLAEGLVAPIGRELAFDTLGEMERRVDLIIDVIREDAVEHGAGDCLRPRGEVVHQIDRVAGVVEEASAAFAFPGPP